MYRTFLLLHHISLKLDMEIDHPNYVYNDIFGFAVSPWIDKNITDWKVYHFF